MNPDIEIVHPSRRYGWRRDLPDFRDYTYDTPKISAVLAKHTKLQGLRGGAQLPQLTDLRSFCPSIKDQQSLGSCFANAVVEAEEWFDRKAHAGRSINLSRIFVYTLDNYLLGIKGDQGGYLRSAMQVLAMFGAPPEQYWAYQESKLDVEPPAKLYAMAQNYKIDSYYRVVPPGVSGQAALDKLLANLAAGFPFVFGFTVYSSINDVGSNGLIPFPKPNESVEGGHAVMCVGYDLARRVFIIQNSWGKGWGDHGFGYLHFDYVLKNLADDFWTVLHANWLDTAVFA